MGCAGATARWPGLPRPWAGLMATTVVEHGSRVAGVTRWWWSVVEGRVMEGGGDNTELGGREGGSQGVTDAIAGDRRRSRGWQQTGGG
jgi:hypothetical protein